jgi:hypothetical protein
MAVLCNVAAWSLFISVTLGASVAAEERVVRVPPSEHTGAPWPRCGSIADEKIERNASYEISSDDPDGKWSFDETGFGQRSPREDAANCVEVFVPTENGCSGIAVLQRSEQSGEFSGVGQACAPGLSDSNCSPGPTQPQSAGFVIHAAISPKGTNGCWMQMRNWRNGSRATSATDFKLRWSN